MIFFVVALALLLHGAFWGAGLAYFAMPPRWRRFWPVLIFPAGWALQSAIVWLGAYANLRGTNSYALASELVPLGLAIAAVVRRGVKRLWDDLGRFGLVWLVTAAVLAMLALPLAIASRGLTTVSLGSCDAADYAAGARVFMEFAHTDRGGFLGLTEVVRVMSADNFFDFWLRLNHFTPSALMALNGSVLQCAPHQIASVLTLTLLATTVPVVFWMARALFGYSGAASLIVAALYGISPIPWYSFAQVSPAPLLAAQAIAWLTWSGVALWHGRLTWRGGMAFAGVLAIAYALVLGAYNFILLVSLVPAIAYVGSHVLRTGAWARGVRWLLVMLAPLVAASVFFWARVAGLVERFMLFQTYDFGWRIPLLTPEGWLGAVQGGDLRPWAWAGLRWLLAAGALAVLGWAIGRSIRNGRRRVWLIASVTIPILTGYAFLEIRGAVRGTNASYDAFKLFTVFYPVLLPAFCWWLTLRWSKRLIDWVVVAVVVGLVALFNVVACGMYVYHMSRPPLLVGGELRQLRRIEPMPDVASVNLLIPDMWSRLWANVFLLQKPQYFLTHTYEGRLNTPLRGEWDLTCGIVQVDLGSRGTRAVTEHYRLVDTRDRGFVRGTLADGWYTEEQLPNGERWCWTQGDATIRIDNPHDRPLMVAVTLDGRTIGERDVAIAPAGSEPAAYVHLNDARQKVSLPAIAVPPGRSTWVLHSKQPPVTPAGDARPLSVCVFGLILRPESRP